MPVKLCSGARQLQRNVFTLATAEFCHILNSGLEWNSVWLHWMYVITLSGLHPKRDPPNWAVLARNNYCYSFQVNRSKNELLCAPYSLLSGYRCEHLLHLSPYKHSLVQLSFLKKIVTLIAIHYLLSPVCLITTEAQGRLRAEEEDEHHVWLNRQICKVSEMGIRNHNAYVHVTYLYLYSVKIKDAWRLLSHATTRVETKWCFKFLAKYDYRFLLEVIIVIFVFFSRKINDRYFSWHWPIHLAIW
jgi:hypothetical protein